MEIKQLLSVVKLLKNEGANTTEIYITMFHTLLLIARHPGVSIKELTEQTGMSYPSMTRAVQGLAGGIRQRAGSEGRPKKPGLGLVEVRMDGEDWRRKELYLTPKGNILMEKIYNL